MISGEAKVETCPKMAFAGRSCRLSSLKTFNRKAYASIRPEVSIAFSVVCLMQIHRNKSSCPGAPKLIKKRENLGK